MRASIAIDMDEVLADALGEHLLRYNRDFSEAVTREHLHGTWLWDYVPPDRAHALEQYIRSEDFFAVLGVMDEAQRVVARLQQRYEVFIASAAMEVPTSFTAKFNWLAEHFPFIPSTHIVFCGNKSILRTDFLIDDNPRQLRLFQQQPETERRHEGILFSAPANVSVTGFRRANNWLDVEAMFLG